MNDSQRALPRAETAESVGVSSRECLEFLDDAKKTGLCFHSMMIIRNGKVAVEWYNEPYGADIPHMMYSASKSVTSTAVGIAVGEGLLSLDDKVTAFFPDYPPKKPDNRFEKLTVRSLLTMTSGKNPSILADKCKVNWTEDYINSPWLFTPGEDFLYISENIYMLCAIVARVTGMSVVDYLMPRLFEPLGIKRPVWETDSQGVEAGGWGLYLTTEDLAKFMLCYLNNGKFEGKQIIPEEWVREAVKKQVTPNQKSKFRDNRVGYGYCFWQTDTEPMCYRADGLFAQYGFNFPSLDAIFVCTGGVADEQVARDCVWRHFPKAFLEVDAADKPVEIVNRQLDVPKPSRRPQTESEINGRQIKIFRHPELAAAKFEPGVLPVAVTYMMCEKGQTPDKLLLRFFKDECLFTWSEGKQRNTVKCGMDGKLRYSSVLLSGLEYHCASYAEWLGDRCLQVHIRPLETVGKRILTFRFKANGVVTLQPSGSPTIDEVCEYIAKASAEVIPYDGIVKAADGVMKAAAVLAEPLHIGLIGRKR